MKCAGKENAYRVVGSQPYLASGGGMGLIIQVTGLFKGDKRNSCPMSYVNPKAIINKNKVGTDYTYFYLEKLKLGFNYQGKYYECNINQSIGTSYNTFPKMFDKLQGGIKNTLTSCGNGEQENPFEYIVIPGHTSSTWQYNRGYIQVFHVNYAEIVTIPSAE